MKRTVCILGAVGLLLTTSVARADNWPGWRGPNHDGISNDKGIPDQWGPNKNLVWTLPMPGPGGSTPAVWGDRLFLTSADGSELALLCVSTDGKLLWKRTLGKTGRGNIRAGEANEASASPCTDGKHVYAFVGTGDFACFDFDGNEVWTFNAQKRYGRFQIQHGMHSTPLLEGDRLYLSLLHGGGHWVIALDKATGKEVWKVARTTDARGESKEAYTSPILWRDGKNAYLVVLGADYTTAHKLDDGSEVWRLGDLNPKSKYSDAFRIIASPVASRELIIVPTARNSQVVAVQPTATGLIARGSEGEQWRKMKGAPDVPSPIIHDGLVYLCRENGVLICLDAKSGDLVYEKSLLSSRYRGSPILVDGKLILSARDSGTFSVVKEGRAFELLATNTLPDEFTASPAVANGRLYLRGFKNLYAVGMPTK